jgi:nitrogen fixation protein FixH
MTHLERILGTKEFTGWHMLAVLGLFFGTVIGVNLTLAYFANSSWTGLVVKNSYVESQRFNVVTAKRLEQEALGWTGIADYRAGVFSFKLTSRSGAVIGGAAISARIGRPSTAAEDRIVNLDAAGPVYSAATELRPGIWEAEVSIAGAHGETWVKSYRFMVKQ